MNEMVRRLAETKRNERRGNRQKRVKLHDIEVLIIADRDFFVHTIFNLTFCGNGVNCLFYNLTDALCRRPCKVHKSFCSSIVQIFPNDINLMCLLIRSGLLCPLFLPDCSCHCTEYSVRVESFLHFRRQIDIDMSDPRCLHG